MLSFKHMSRLPKQTLFVLVGPSKNIYLYLTLTNTLGQKIVKIIFITIEWFEKIVLKLSKIKKLN